MPAPFGPITTVMGASWRATCFSERKPSMRSSVSNEVLEVHGGGPWDETVGVRAVAVASAPSLWRHRSRGGGTLWRSQNVPSARVVSVNWAKSTGLRR